MSKNLNSFLLFVFSFTQVLAASNPSSCFFVDKTAQMGPVRDQGSMGWCYANTTADLIGYHFNIQLTEPVSAIQIALAYNYRWQDNPLDEAGFVDKALMTALAPPLLGGAIIGSLDRGFCPASLIEKAFIPPDGPLHLKSNLNRILKQKNILEASENSNAVDYLLRVSNFLCKGSRVYNKSQKLQIISRYDGDLMNEVDAALNQDNIVGITYKSGFLVQAVGQSHASTIIGRRWKKSQCQYLIRNSWGNNCTQYSKYVDQCIDGNVWVAENHIKANLDNIVYINEREK